MRDIVDRHATWTSNRLAETLFTEHADAIHALPDDRQQEYRDNNTLAATPQIDRLGRPRTRIEDYVEEVDGQYAREELVKLHLMADENGDAPITKLNGWEGEAVKHDIARDGALAWYETRHARRPTRSVSYRDETTGSWRSMHPDFVFSNDKVDGQAKASIVDPHGHHLDDSLMKLQALATFAEDHGDSLHRIEALSKVGDVMKKLDLKNEDDREGIKKGGQTVDWFYNYYLAINYYAKETVGG